MATGESGLHRDLSRNLAGVLLSGQADPSEYAQIRRQTSANIEENRQRFNENQQIVARQAAEMAMAGNFMLLLFIGAVVLTYLIAGFVLFVIGCSIVQNSDKSCDQPLRWWLLMMLWAVMFEKVIQCCAHFCCAESKPKVIFVVFSVKICLLCLGFWWRSKCVTCPETNPNLYQFVTIYLIYKLVSVVASGLLTCLGISFIAWMIANDIGPFGNRQPAGRPGLIHELQTVAYSPELFQQGEAHLENEPPECSICQDEFNAETVIKITPCGHYFHESCLEQWLNKYANNCPLCRQNLEEAVDAAKTAP